MADLAKLSNDDLKSFDIKRLSEVETDLRRQMATLRMEIYTDRKNGGQVRGLKKSLARVLTYRSQLLRKQTK